MQPIFTDWCPSHADEFGRKTLELRHSLAGRPLFQDDALAELIEATPRCDYHVSTQSPHSHDPKSRREGVIEGLSGGQVIEAIGNGHIWLNLRNPDLYRAVYRHLLDEIYAELEERLRVKIFKRQMTLLISSPQVRVGYHCDVPGQTLWQLRGTKRVLVYPAHAPYLPPEKLEKIVMGEAHEVSLSYQPGFDAQAQSIDLVPGRMLTWAHNAPHRILNEDCLNVSLTTEHWTAELRNAYATTYANGILRSRLGLEKLSAKPAGPMLYPKLGLAAAYKLSGLQKQRRHKFKIDFRVDPNAPGGFADIPAYELAK